MNAPVNKGRRRFLITSAVAVGGGLAIGAAWFYRPRDVLSAPDALRAAPGEQIFNAWLKIAADGRIVVQVPRQEMGQGISTALPMLVAEELDADFDQVTFEQAPIDPVYANATMLGEGVPFRPEDTGLIAEFARLTQFKAGQMLGIQATGGSTSLRDAWEPMRRAGATARAMLVSAAAARFGVRESECETRAGRVRHAASGQEADYGELAEAAARLAVPNDVRLKDPADYVLLGKSVPRLDVPAKSNGTAEYGIDVKLPGMVYAAIAQCPVLGGEVGSYDRDAITEWPGVKAVLDVPRTSTSEPAVVVVATHYWQAKKALAALAIEWHEGQHAGFNSVAQREQYARLLDENDGRTYDSAGDSEAAMAAATDTLEAAYHVPYLAHATMEPINCTAVVRSDGTGEVWLGNQAPSLVRWIAGRTAGIPAENVTVHTPYLGGGFGRRGELDIVVHAVTTATKLPDVPVQLIWSREEDIQHDLYRPAAAVRFAAGLTDGRLDALQAKVVSQSCVFNLTRRLVPAFASDLAKDRTTTEGLFDQPYAIPNRRVAHVQTDEPVPVGFWRSVGHSHNAFFIESFVDECAASLKQDPYALRRTLLSDRPRYLRVLETAAKQAGWGEKLPAGMGRGIALAESFGSIVAQVADVEVAGGEVRVRRVVCAVDCGFAVNPDNVVAQMESGIIYALSAALYGEITFDGGRVQQSNFPDYPMVRLVNAPDIEVHVIQSGIEHLGGVGEPGTPPLAPAVCNAIYAATGKRIRELPIRV